MSAEERWADRQEWAEEKRRGFDVEINGESDIKGQGEVCQVSMCKEPAVKRYEIKKVGAPGHGTDVDLCADHDHEETAWDVYSEQD